MITIRVRALFRLFAISAMVEVYYELCRKMVNNAALTFQEWFILITLPFSTLIFVFIIQTLVYTFTPYGASVYWKIGFGRLKLWEQKNYQLSWRNIVRIYSVLPVWIPFHMIGVSGIQDGVQGRNFFIGTLTTKKKESLLYIAEHVSPKVIDDEVKRLVKRYQAKARKKEKTSTPAK